MKPEELKKMKLDEFPLLMTFTECSYFLRKCYDYELTTQLLKEVPPTPVNGRALYNKQTLQEFLREKEKCMQ